MKLILFAKSGIKQILLLVYRSMVKVLPIRENVIVFQSNLGRNYSGNPKWICEELIKTGLIQKYRCYYILNHKEQLPLGVTVIKNSRLRYYYIMAVAKVWISDTRFPNYIIKRKGTVYLQTWHGTPLKKLALDMDCIKMAGEKNLFEYKESFRKNASTWDVLISQNSFSSSIFRRAFDFHGELLEIGYPRNDILFQKNTKEEIKQLKQKLSLPFDKKIILYAPTWRDDSYYDKASYRFVSALDYESVKTALEGEYVMLLKYHYMVQEQIDWDCFGGFYRSFDHTFDISELYLVADVLITDYSSVMFDYGLLKRPMLFFAYDLDAYKNVLRGFYFHFEKEAPGPIVQTTQELIDQLKNADWNDYREKYLAFQEKYHEFEDGHACKKVLDWLIQQMQ